MALHLLDYIISKYINLKSFNLLKIQ